MPQVWDILLTAPDITAKELAKVTQLTGIQFPEGTTELGYLYLGSGIDDALTLKIKIPNEQKGVLLENEISKNGDKSKYSIQIARNESWWKLDQLEERTDRNMELPKGRYLACTIGRENSEWITYISWMST